MAHSLRLEPVYEDLQLFPLILVGEAEVSDVVRIDLLVLLDHLRPSATVGR